MCFSISKFRFLPARFSQWLRGLRVKLSLAFRRQEAATAIEYALLLGTVVVAVAAGLTAFSDEVSGFFNNALNTFKNGVGP